MPIAKKFLLLALLALLPLVWTGCATPYLSNLTPSRLPRKENGQYQFEVQWNSRQQSVVKDSLKGYVVIGLDQYPMQRVPLLTNRWETLVPIPADQDVVTYYYKFDFDYLAIPHRKQDSRTSKYFQLYLLEN